MTTRRTAKAATETTTHQPVRRPTPATEPTTPEEGAVARAPVTEPAPSPPRVEHASSIERPGLVPRVAG